MIHHTCIDCQRGFIATGYEEAEEELASMRVDAAEHGSRVEEDFVVAVEQNVVAYAQYCPYCGSENVEAR